MNKHILLVMKWLNDSTSVSQEELKVNYAEAVSAYADANDVAVALAVTAAAADAAADSSEAHATHHAASAYASAHAAANLVNRYFELTGEDRSEYE